MSVKDYFSSFQKRPNKIPRKKELLLRHFDEEWYLQQNPDILEAGVEPLAHYLEYGWKEGCSPNPYFDTKWYLRKNPDIVEAGVEPLAHYLEYGWKEGRSPNPYFDTKWYLQQNPDIVEAGVEPLAHYLEYGWEEGRSPNPHFDSKWYLQQNPDIVEAGVEPLAHYLEYGWKEGCSPNPYFDTKWYLQQNPDIVEAGVEPLAHYLCEDIDNKISPTPLFDEQEYLALNPNLKKTYPNSLFEHWIMHGLAEGLRFDRNLFITHNRDWAVRGSDLQQRGVDGFVRFAIHNRAMGADILKMRSFRDSELFARLLADANDIDPNVGTVDNETLSLLPPLYDTAYAEFVNLLNELPDGCFDALVLMPFCKLGGSDFVGGVLTRTLHELGARPLVLRTDQPDWERPDWFPENVATADISAICADMTTPARQRTLYEIIRHLRPKIAINVNSRLAFETFKTFGARLNQFTSLYCYYFCADRTPTGQEAGYPVWYFAPLLPNLAGALIDTHFLADTLIGRYALDGSLAAKVHVLYTPAMQPDAETVLAEVQADRSATHERPCILWAGRFDRQKRFDLLVDIARTMPEVDFRCWGKAVLDEPPDLSNLPANLELNPPFTRYEDLPLKDCDGWLFTSAWEGMPTILIEIARMGMPVVASAVGGVPELVDETTGWALAPDAMLEDYVTALKEMIENPAARRTRGKALRTLATYRHGRELFRNRLVDILGLEAALCQTSALY